MVAKAQTGAQILFRDSTDYGPAANNVLVVGTADTTVQLNLEGLADGDYRASAKVDLGASRDIIYAVTACIEHVSNPTDGETCDFYWCESSSPTAAVANPGDLTGVDEDITDTSALLGQCIRIGSLPLRADTINIGTVGIATPQHRYGMLLVGNLGTPNTSTDAVEMSVLFTAIENGDDGNNIT